MFGGEAFKEEIPQDKHLANTTLIDDVEVLKLENALPIIKENNRTEFYQLKIKKKCYYCFEFIQATLLKAHVKKCQKQHEKMLKKATENLDFTGILDIKAGYQNKYKCIHCHQYFMQFLIKQHEKQCLIRKLSLEKQNGSKEQNKRDQKKLQIADFYGNVCVWCQVQFLRENRQIHEITCEIKEKIQNDLAKFQLSQAQFKAVWNMYEKSASQNQYYRTKMLKTLGSYGYNEGDLVLISEFIEYQAPICIHFNISKSISYFVRDNQYRNLFETNKSGGTTSTQSRKQWENYLFGEFYDDCQPNQRVKYGVLNYANDKYGSKKCRKYGDSIMVLKDQVRKRCTISHNRKYAPEEIVATLRYINAVLIKFSKDELNALFLASRGFEIDSSELRHFKEVHIHGSILFGRDIKCIYTSKEEREKNNVSANIFQQRFGVKILTFEDLEAEEVQ